MPTSKQCIHCGEPILPGEALAPYTENTAHWECGLRSVVGGVNHQKGLCTCCLGGTLDPDPEGMTRREAARAATDLWLSTTPYL